mgnify:FL=1
MLALLLLLCSGEGVVLLRGHMGSVWAILPLPGDILLSGGDDKCIGKWEGGKLLQMVESGHTRTIRCMAVFPGGDRFATGSEDKTIKMWDVASLKCVGTLKGHSGWVSGITFAPGFGLISASWDNSLKVWDEAGTCIATLLGHTGDASCVAMLSREQCVSGSWDNTLRVWNLLSMECEKVLEGHSSEVFSVCVVGKGRVASGSWEGELFVWDVAGGTRLMSLSGHTDWIMALLGFRNGLLASASGGRSIKVWDVSSGKLMKSLETGTPNYALAVTSSGHLVSGGNDKLLRIFPHEATGGPVAAVEVGWGWVHRRKVVLFRVALRKDVRRGYGGVVGSGVC